MMQGLSRPVAVVALVAGAACSQAGRTEPDGCREVRFADLGWTDIAATTGLASVVLEGLGYRPTTRVTSVPDTLNGLKENRLDVFLGNWMPAMRAEIEPYLTAGQITQLPVPNLVGAKYTLAVPRYLAEAGLTSFADIAKFETALNRRIHGLEQGNEGNGLVLGMIAKNQFGLGSFELVQSSEAGMLAEVERAVAEKRGVVFLAWEPHPMNVRLDLVYLTGGDDVFGPNFGEAKVFTLVPAAYATRCPNVGALLANLQFTLAMENGVMAAILAKVAPEQAAREWLTRHPEVLEKWLSGVTTFDGGEGLAAVRTFLKLQ